MLRGKSAAMGSEPIGFGHGHAIDTSSRTDPQRGRCEYEVESLLWQSTVAIKSVGSDVRCGRFAAVVLRNGSSHRLQHDCGNLVWQ